MERSLPTVLAGFIVAASAAGCSQSTISGGANASQNLLPAFVARASSGRAAAVRRAPAPAAAGYSVLYSFAGSPDGVSPFGGVAIDAKGNIFGTTYSGGAYYYGMVWELSPSGKSYAEKIIYQFESSNGANPLGAVVLNADDDLYITTSQGGQFGAGTVMELAEGKSSTYGVKTMHAFGNGTDGSVPNAAVVQVGKTLYMTTAAGGKYGEGAIIALKLPKLEAVDVYDFQDTPDGRFPISTLVADSSGALYGTTVEGGLDGLGCVFKFVPKGNGGTETVLYSFLGLSSGDGASPNGGVLLGKDGAIYGTTSFGGLTNDGTVFRLNPSPSGYTETLMHSFAGAADGAQPFGGLAARGKLLYGTTSAGSGSLCIGCGTIFQIAPDGSNYSALYAFDGTNGQNPIGTLFVRGNALYGTASNGGADSDGVVFRYTL